MNNEASSTSPKISEKKNSTRDGAEEKPFVSEKNILPVTDDKFPAPDDVVVRQNSLEMYEEDMAEGLTNLGAAAATKGLLLHSTFDLRSDLEKIQCGKYCQTLLDSGYNEEVYFMNLLHY